MVVVRAKTEVQVSRDKINTTNNGLLLSINRSSPWLSQGCNKDRGVSIVARAKMKVKVSREE